MNISRIKRGAINRSMKFINERRGWTTNRKIIVIESDDWGSIRMPNREVYEKSLNKGIRVDQSSYNKFDTLASVTDFEAIFDVFRKHKDKNGNHPVITANTIVANPDFEKIKENNFQDYFFEPFTETLKKYPNRSFDSWKEGIDEKLFYPQLHGREHLNVGRWMHYLQKPSAEVHFMFENKMWGFGPKISLEKNPSFVQAFDSNKYLKNHSINKILGDAFEIFESTFDFKSKSFIAPNYIWDDKVEKVLYENGIEYLQGSLNQKLPTKGVRHRYIGQQNGLGQIYLTRNVVFEPASLPTKDWVGSALKEVNNAFKLSKPAIFSTHRVAFMGSIFEENRTNNLKMMDELFNKIIKCWPDVEFMHSAELGDLIKQDIK